MDQRIGDVVEVIVEEPAVRDVWQDRDEVRIRDAGRDCVEQARVILRDEMLLIRSDRILSGRHWVTYADESDEIVASAFVEDEPE